jgi:hypothetical protein
VDVGDEGFEVHVCQKVPKRGLLAAFDRLAKQLVSFNE